MLNLCWEKVSFRDCEPGSKSKAGGDDGGQTLRDGGDSESDGDLEVVDGALDPGATVGGVVEVANVDRPHGNADQSDHLAEKNCILSVST